MWRAIAMCGVCGALSASCSSPKSTASDSASSGRAGGSLAGTWNLTTTATGGSPVVTTLTIGQNSLSITSPDFTFTATRSGNVLTFTDNDPPNDPTSTGVLTATQTGTSFNAGIVPFDLGGSWTMQGGPKGASATVTCTLSMSSTEIDGACQYVSPAGPWFSFTMKKMAGAASSFGDFGGTWMNTWTSQGGTYPCTIEFTGDTITTCMGGAMDGQLKGSPLAGINATYDCANIVSGSAQGWAEFSATR